ncbi:MAG: helix-turn-helix domain-containing protein [Eubacteriales bacterium]|nr:helix-turn-helix domain-containing protein [Eubacteriales bacterium]
MKFHAYEGKHNISGKAIKRERKRKGLSQEQLAAHIQLQGLPMQQKTISRIETGERVVADYELLLFAKVLGVAVGVLLGEK